MKKNVFGVLGVLALTLALVGCENPDKKNDNNGGITGLTVSPNELILTEDNLEQRLSVSFTPSGATGTVVWTSSDTTVATVTTKGLVSAVSYGTAEIIATCGDYSDTCFVKVQQYIETLSFNAFTYLDLDSTAYGGEVVEMKGYKCYLSKVSIGLFSEGFYINNSGKLDGATKGALIEFDAPMYYAPGALNGGKGTVFILGNWYIQESNPDNESLVGLASSIDSTKFISSMEDFITAYNANPEGENSSYLEEAASAFTNAIMHVYTYTTTTSGQSGYYGSYIPDAVIPSAEFIARNNTDYALSEWMIGVDYSSVTYKPLAGYFPGCNIGVNEDQTAYVWIDKYIHFDDEITAVYGEKTDSSAPELVATPARILSIDNPQAYKNLREQLDGDQVKFNSLKMNK